MATHTRPFESVESAQEYVGLLIAAVEKEAVRAREALETMHLDNDRHRDALRLVDYKLQALTKHLLTSKRLLNDLRSLRRYLLDERAGDQAVTEFRLALEAVEHRSSSPPASA